MSLMSGSFCSFRRVHAPSSFAHRYDAVTGRAERRLWKCMFFASFSYLPDKKCTILAIPAILKPTNFQSFPFLMISVTTGLVLQFAARSPGLASASRGAAPAAKRHLPGAARISLQAWLCEETTNKTRRMLNVKKKQQKRIRGRLRQVFHVRLSSFAGFK